MRCLLTTSGTSSWGQCPASSKMTSTGALQASLRLLARPTASFSGSSLPATEHGCHCTHTSGVISRQRREAEQGNQAWSVRGAAAFGFRILSSTIHSSAIIITLEDKGWPCKRVYEEVNRAWRWQVEDGAEDAEGPGVAGCAVDLVC